MCFKQKDKWQSFTATKEYLDIVKVITSIYKLHLFLKNYTWKKEKKDYWKTPIEFLKSIKPNDCEDFARFAVDVLVRIIKIVKARFIIYKGYNHEKHGDKLKGHAICAFPYRGKLAIFSNNKFYSGFEDFTAIGHKYYPDGLKSMEVRDWLGYVEEKKKPLFGTF